ncbi:hypothetical protein [Psychrobacillus phage Perkons]|nr:hypothetical protein [Psychrobacillus phage Perkons]
MVSNTYLEFNNPVQIIWRSGSAFDPFVDRLDITKVVNQRVALLEIPDELFRVRISDMQEINYERFIKDTLAVDDYYVDYSNGFVYFHHSKEAFTLSIVYKGRGLILYPSSRIVHFDGTNPAENLHELIEKTKTQIMHLIDETQNFEHVMKNMVIATNLTLEATDRTIEATQEAKTATKLVHDAYKTTVLIYQPFVQTEDDIRRTYPNPLTGWTVQVFDTGVRYRWNGQDWIPIDAFGGNIPLASDAIDGLMSKQQYTKLEAITEEVDTRVVVFIIPQDVLAGIQDPHIVFPFDGDIEEIKAFVSKSGSSATTIRLEKSVDFIGWNNITSTPIQINANKYFDNGLHIVSNTKVVKGDIFRLYIPFTGDIKNLTVNIKIKLRKEVI